MPSRPSMRGMGADALFSQQTSKTARQDAIEPVNQPASLPASPPASKLVKVTFYVTEDQNVRLEEIRLARRKRGHQVDKSALVREAIDALPELP